MWKKIFKGSSPSEAKETWENPLYRGIDRARLPVHTALIMDGNGRWAEGRGLLRTAGHSAGVDALKQILKTAIDLELPALTVYAFSTENWKRPSAEVDFLMRLFVDYLTKEIDEMDEDNIKLRFLGRMDELSPALQDLAQTAVDRMADNTAAKTRSCALRGRLRAGCRRGRRSWTPWTGRCLNAAFIRTVCRRSIS